MNQDDDHVQRDLVPLVRAAADEVPVGDVPHLPGYDDLRRACLEDEARLRVQHEINEHIAAALINAPIRTVPEPVTIATVHEWYDQIAAMPPRPSTPVFMTQRQFDLLKQNTPAEPYFRRPHDLGVIARLAGVQVALLPERTWWQRFRAWLRRRRWWR